MRLLTHDSNGELSLTRDLPDDKIPPYAILSHTWNADDDEEVKLHELQSETSRAKAGYKKIEFCGQQARKDKWHYFWVDTCCIDKTNQVELSKAITSMYRWYQNAQICYVYLTDVSSPQLDLDAAVNGPPVARPWELSFRNSRWFTRGWTLQELLAPKEVVFYSKDCEYLGTKGELTDLIYSITNIPHTALRGQPLSQFPVIERMRWAQGRVTKEKEDQAYCLFGMFDVYLPLIYGEGDNAFRRLQREIDDKISGDDTARTHNNATHQPTEVRSLGMCLASAPLIEPGDFIGRAAEIDVMRRILRPEESFVTQRRVVLGGIGGIGKTQLAIAYARQYEHLYTSVLWLNATSEQTLYTGLRSINHPFVTIEDLGKLDNVQVLARVHMWLSQPQHTLWLLIFDNYDDPDLFDIDNFCPNIGQGSIIITTRLPESVAGSQVRVQPLKATSDSLDILQTRSGRDGVKSDAGACRLAERLAGLPLALVTAGVYLRKSNISFQHYLDIYELRWRVENRRPVLLKEYRDRTLYTTWNISYSRLETENPDAAQVLKLLAYFDHQEVWYELLHAGISTCSPSWLRNCLADQIDFESTMSTLVDYCLVEVQHITQSYSVHGCVHDWILGELNVEIDLQSYWHAFDSVVADVYENYSEELGLIRYARISLHAVRLTHHRFMDKWRLSYVSIERLDQIALLAHMLRHQIQFVPAELLHLRTLVGYERALGPGHTSTLTTVNNLGNLYSDQGKLDEAEQMYRRALAGRERALGPDHTSTLTTVNNLGTLYRDQGKLDEAEQMYRRALAGYERALGPEHPSTLLIARNASRLHVLKQTR